MTMSFVSVLVFISISLIRPIETNDFDGDVFRLFARHIFHRHVHTALDLAHQLLKIETDIVKFDTDDECDFHPSTSLRAISSDIDRNSDATCIATVFVKPLPPSVSPHGPLTNSAPAQPPSPSLT